MPRLFSAIEIPQSIASRLMLLRAGLAGARWIDPENYHLTLRFIDDVDGATAHDFTLALSEIAAAPFELRLNGLGSFGGNKPRAIFAGFAPSEGLAALRRANERAARKAGLPPEGRNFQPHVTLARLRGSRADAVAAYLERQGRIEAEAGSEQTHNVPATLPGDAAYSPLWLVAVCDNANWRVVKDLKTAFKAKVLAPTAATVNCPYRFHRTFGHRLRSRSHAPRLVAEHVGDKATRAFLDQIERLVKTCPPAEERIRHVLGPRVRRVVEEAADLVAGRFRRELDEIVIVRAVHGDQQIEARKVCLGHLPRTLARNVDAARERRGLRARIRRLSDVPIPKSGRVDFEAVEHALLLGDATEHAFGHWRAADIAEANEQETMLGHAD